MKQVSTLFLKSAVFLIGLTVLALCVFVLPEIAKEMIDVMPVQYELLPILIAMAASTIPFYIALYQALKLLNLIDKNKAFSELSIRALKTIKKSATTIGFLYIACVPYLYIIAEGDDAPGVFAIGLVIIFASIVVAVLAAVLQKLLQNAIDIKSENDLTV
jgi:predicted lysophospholipase L1 biosynthesis ABC-type transport system permease subunit